MPVLFKGQAFSFIEGTYVTTRHRRVKHKPSARQLHNLKKHLHYIAQKNLPRNYLERFLSG